jgi:type IV pilus assembly protein PilM
MLNSKSFLAVDFGAGNLKVAEFEVNEAGGLRLKQYAVKALGPEGAQDTTREAVVLKAMQEVLAEKAVKSKVVNVCAPGFHVFSKFVKLPPVDAGKVNQIIQYEAQQNVPFPLAEVVWDYQILGTTQSGELEVLLVAIKAEIVEGLFRATEATGLHLQLTDVSPAALCNAFRYNYGDVEECTMLLDIGAKTSNLLFFEKGKVFSRSINLGANSITQDFSHEAKLKFPQAEKLKLDEGFVSLGGAYEEPENPHQAAISKIARQFMTRLHIQVNQTMQFYRGQQGGSAPVRLYLSGGASVMPYTAQFFAEKLNVPVEYFNPLRNIQIDPAINLEELARVAHSLGEVVGLGLRNLAHCPVELNLMPESTLRWQTFNQKKPYFIATVFALVLVLAAMGLLFGQLAAVKQEQTVKIEDELEPMQAAKARFDTAYSNLNKTKADLSQYVDWLDQRFFWPDVLSQMRNILIDAQNGIKADPAGGETAIWIEKMTTMTPSSGAEEIATDTSSDASHQAGYVGMSRASQIAFLKRYGLLHTRLPAASSGGGSSDVAPSNTAAATSNTNEVATVSLTFRAVSLPTPGADQQIAYAVMNRILACPLFDPDPTATHLLGTIGTPQDINGSDDPGTFTFGANVKLKHPLKF